MNCTDRNPCPRCAQRIDDIDTDRNSPPIDDHDADQAYGRDLNDIYRND